MCDIIREALFFFWGSSEGDGREVLRKHVTPRFMLHFFQLYVGVVLPFPVCHTPGWESFVRYSVTEIDQGRRVQLCWVNAVVQLLFVHVPCALLAGLSLAVLLLLTSQTLRYAGLLVI